METLPAELSDVTWRPTPGGVQTSSLPALTSTSAPMSFEPGSSSDIEPALTWAELGARGAARGASASSLPALRVRSRLSSEARARSTSPSPAETVTDRWLMSAWGSVGSVTSQSLRPPYSQFEPRASLMSSELSVASMLGPTPDVFDASRVQPGPSVVATLRTPQPLSIETDAGAVNAPDVDATFWSWPCEPQFPANRGATANAAPTTSPGISAAASRAGNANRDRRSTRLSPIAMIASGQSRTRSASTAVSTVVRSATTRTPPTASRTTPQ